MLQSLSIRDIVVFDRLDLELPDGLCALTGETGAGKSILLDSLGLTLGQRAEGRMVRHGADRGQVTAIFELPDDHPANTLLDEQGIDAEDLLILRRAITREGRSRAYVNDHPVSAGTLARLAETLVEIHGQAAETGLLDPKTHRGILDTYGSLDKQAKTVRASWQVWQDIKNRLKDLTDRLEKAAAEESYLRHVLSELDELAPEPDEESQLADRRAFLMSVEKIAGALADAQAALEDNGGVAGRLRAAERALDRVRDSAGEKFQMAYDSLQRAAIETDEAANALATLASDLDVTPGEVDQVEERLFALRAAARKHQVEPDALPALRDKFAADLQSIETGSADLARLQDDAKQAEATFIAAAEKLSDARIKAAGRLDKAVAGELEPLRMGGARFVTSVTRLDADQWTAAGMDRVGFQVATNPAAAPGPIGKIASGGELARFMLALKVVLAATGAVPVLVFDEVDRGVGGATADAVGERLRKLADQYQVLVVTHSPQVAARANAQWMIEKTLGDAVTTAVSRLDPDQRREEIARMLSGAEITDEARAAADRLIAAN